MLPRRKLGAKLVPQSRWTGTSIDEDRAARSPEQHRLPVADVHDHRLGRSPRPRRQCRERDRRRRDRRDREAHLAAVARRIRSGDRRSKRGVVGDSEPGRKLRHGDRRHRHTRQHIADLFDVRDEAHHRQRDQASHFWDVGQRSKKQAAGDQDGKDGQRQRVRYRRHRRQDVKVGCHHRQCSDLGRAGHGEGFAQDVG